MSTKSKYYAYTVHIITMTSKCFLVITKQILLCNQVVMSNDVTEITLG